MIVAAERGRRLLRPRPRPHHRPARRTSISGMIAFAMAWVALLGAVMTWALAQLEKRAPAVAPRVRRRTPPRCRRARGADVRRLRPLLRRLVGHRALGPRHAALPAAARRRAAECFLRLLQEPFAGYSCSSTPLELHPLRARFSPRRRDRHPARPLHGLVPLARPRRDAALRGAALHRADRVGALRRALVRHRRRRPILIIFAGAFPPCSSMPIAARASSRRASSRRRACTAPPISASSPRC